MTVEYKQVNGACVPQRVHTVLISAHHSKDVTADLQGSIKMEVFEKVVKVKPAYVCNIIAINLLDVFSGCNPKQVLG